MSFMASAKWSFMILVWFCLFCLSGGDLFGHFSMNSWISRHSVSFLTSGHALKRSRWMQLKMKPYCGVSHSAFPTSAADGFSSTSEAEMIHWEWLSELGGGVWRIYLVSHISQQYPQQLSIFSHYFQRLSIEVPPLFRYQIFPRKRFLFLQKCNVLNNTKC